MPSVAALRSVKIVYASEGAEKVRSDAEGVAAAQSNMAQAAERAALVSEQSARRQLSATSGFDRLRLSLDGNLRAFQRYEADLLKVDRAVAADVSLTREAAQVKDLLRQRYDAAAAAANRLSAEQRALARDTMMAREAAVAQASAYQASLNQRLGVRPSVVSASREEDLRSAFADADRRRAAVDPLFKAQQAYRNDLTSLRGDLAAGVLSEDAYTAALGRRKAAFTDQMATLGRVSAAQREATASTVALAEANERAARGWSGLGAQGSASLASLDFQRRMSSASAVKTPAMLAQEAAERGPARRLRADETQNLLFQGIDVTTSLQGGMNPLTVALQQGGQVLPMFVGSGSASLKESFKQAGEAAGGFLTKIGPVGVGLGALGVAAGVGVAALLSYRSAQSETEKAIGGVGRVAGVTLGQVNALADAQARAGGMSRSTAREAAAVYAGTGRVGADLLGEALGATRGFSKFMGVDQTEGAATLAAALGDVSRGATDLSQRYGLLNDSQAESVRRMDAQGDRFGAQKRLLDAVRDSTRGLAEQTTGWGRVTETVSNLWDGLGRGVDRAVTGGDLDARLKTAQDALAEARRDAVGSNSFYRQAVSDPRIAKFQDDVATLQKQVDTRDALIERVQRAQRSVEIGGLVRSLNPELAEFQSMQDRVERLRKAIADPLKFGLDQRQLVDVTLAFERLSRTTKSTAEDIERYGSVSVATLNRQADFDVRTAGMNPVEKASAEIDKKLSDFIREKSLDPNVSAVGVQAQYDLRMSAQSDLFERNRLAQERDQRLRDVREMEGMRRERDQQREALRIRTEDSAVRSSRVPDNYVQSVFGAESRFNPLARNPNSTATGLGQFIEKTWLDVFRQEFPERAAAMSRSEILARRLDPADNERATLAYARQNARALERAEIPVNNASLYASHHFGVGGAIALYRADPSTSARSILGDEAARANPSTIGNLTAGQSIRAVSNLMARNDPGLRSAQQQVEQMRSEVNVLDLSTAARARAERAQDLLNQEQAKGSEVGRTYTNVQELLGGSVKNASLEAQAGRQAILDVATAYGRASAEVTNFRGRQELMFERSQLGRSEASASAFARTYSRYRETSSPEAQAFQETARMNEGLRETRLLATDAFSGMLTDLRRGGDLVSSLSNMAGRLADRLLSMAADKTIGALFAGGGGTSADGGLFAGIAKFLSSGFDVGGYTGPGDRLAPAGIVHRGEVVWSQRDVARVGGVAAAEAIRLGLRGYDMGGAVGMPAWMPPPANASQGPSTLKLEVIDQVGVKMETREVSDGRGGRKQQLVVAEMVASGIRSPQGQQALREPQVATR